MSDDGTSDHPTSDASEDGTAPAGDSAASPAPARASGTEAGAGAAAAAVAVEVPSPCRPGACTPASSTLRPA